MVLFAFMLMTVESFLLGPSALLGLPSTSLALVTIGITMMGGCLSIGLVPLLSEIIEILEDT